jgi:hypothetical protein
VSSVTARNVVILALVAAAVYFLPGGGDAAAFVGALLSTAILAAFVLLAVRFYREHRIDLFGLGDRWRGLLYGAIAVGVLDLAARPRLASTPGGSAVFVIVLIGCVVALVAVFRAWRSYV